MPSVRTLYRAALLELLARSYSTPVLVYMPERQAPPFTECVNCGEPVWSLVSASHSSGQPEPLADDGDLPTPPERGRR